MSRDLIEKIPHFEIKSIPLFESTAIRYEGVSKAPGMGVEVSLENENGDYVDGELECRSICSVTIRNGSDDFALFISHFRPLFQVDQDADFSEGTVLGDALNDEVLRQVYPYHRQLLADMMSRMNLPVFTLPVLSEEMLLGNLSREQ